jgi:hypothetical protein
MLPSMLGKETIDFFPCCYEHYVSVRQEESVGIEGYC